MKRDESNIADEYKRRLRVAEVSSDKIVAIVYDFVRQFSKSGADCVEDVREPVFSAVLDAMIGMNPVENTKKKRMRS